MPHFELIRWRQRVQGFFVRVTGRLGHRNRAMGAAQVSPIGYAGMLVICSEVKVQAKRAGRIVGIKRAIFLRLAPSWAVLSLLPSTWFGTTSHGGPNGKLDKSFDSG
jgi:hypothetical protein